MSSSASERFGIAELAQSAGVTPRTIRYYVTEGLLPAPTGAGPYRTYSTDHLLRLQAIKHLKELYLPLNEIRQRLAGLARPELEKLARGSGPNPVTTALEYSEALLSRGPGSPTVSSQPVVPSPQFLASLTPPSSAHSSPRLQLGRAYVLPGETDGEPRTASASEVKPNVEDDDVSVWHRVSLAPGVELSYQLTGDHARDSAVLRLVRNARQILKTVS